MSNDKKEIMTRRQALVDDLVSELSERKSPLKTKSSVSTGIRICLTILPPWG